MTARTGVDLEGNPNLPIPNDDIDSPWGQSVVGRIVPRYSTEAVRNASIPAPDQGQLTYVLDDDVVQIFDGSTWVDLPTFDALAGIYLPLTGGTISGALNVTATLSSNSDISAGDDVVATNRVLASQMISSGGASFAAMYQRNVWIGRSAFPGTVGRQVGELWLDDVGKGLYAFDGADWVLMLAGV